jgi:outer membrane cobalamin receptor
MKYIKLLLTVSFLFYFTTGFCQQQTTSLHGVITDSDGITISDIIVSLNSISAENVISFKTKTDNKGVFKFENLVVGSYNLDVSDINYVDQQKELSIQKGQNKLKLILKSNEANLLQDVQIAGNSTVKIKKSQPFAIEVVDMKKVMDRDVDVNRLMDGLAGLRVSENGGLGSGFNYSINGLSGKAVKFFIDGIPMENFGTSYSINNFPANNIDRIEVYKGVMPVDLGGDALGGAINIISRKQINNYLDLSYSYGSFNTNRASLSGRWRSDKSGLTVQTNAFYNYSDNDYKVWGNTAQVADEFGRIIEGEKYKRFNDQFKSYTASLEAGFTNVSWADQLMFGFTYSDLDKGIQTGRTMAFVYGKVKYEEKFAMPSIKFQKKNFLKTGINIDLYGSLNLLRGTTIDTSSFRYKWTGEAFLGAVNGELGGIRYQKSIYTLEDKSSLGRINLSYSLSGKQTLNLNYLVNTTTRSGSDAISLAEWTIPFLQPQDMIKHVGGLSYQHIMFDDRLTNIVFIKTFAYDAKASVYDYRGGSNKELFYQNTKEQAWGFGYAGKLAFENRLMLKFSAENTTRLPEAAELLGDGTNILNAPSLKPEESMNINLSVHKILGDDENKFTLSLGSFFRNTKNLIWLSQGDLFGTARYENIDRIRTLGIETDLLYKHGSLFEISANATYQDIRNRLKHTPSGASNNVFNDRLRNTPYLMANAEMRFKLDNILKIKQKLSAYISTHYVCEYFLGWPSLGEKSEKNRIPTQFVQDAGVTYAFQDNKYSINFGIRNIFNQQVYDNYLLQKPGRFMSLKLRYLIQ